MEINGKVNISDQKIPDVELYLNNKKISLNDDMSFSHKFHLFKKGGGLNESKRLEIPLLGEIPYSEDLMKSIDKGEPLVFSDSVHPVSDIFIKIAKSLEH
tara:strand:- start:5133 stop:5432 length:300 start_codon:yes stop_codon:yes gene_type:complete